MKPTQTRKIFFGILALIMAMNLSCKKNTGSKVVNTNAQAIIINEGPVAGDGCGWLIKIDATDSIYNAPNLTAKYQVDSLKVNITYHKLSTRFYCGNIAPPNHGITEIQLDAISNR